MEEHRKVYKIGNPRKVAWYAEHINVARYESIGRYSKIGMHRKVA